MGTPDSRRMVRQTSKPSMPGSIGSRTIRSGRSRRKACNALGPSPTAITRNPACSRQARITWRIRGSSSTTSTVRMPTLCSA
jgi:hypothetical protein